MFGQHMPSEAQYSLDSMHELMEITNDTACGVHLFHANHFVFTHGGTGTLDNLKNETNRYHLDWLNNKATSKEKKLMATALFTGSQNQLENIFENVSYGLYTGKDDPYWWVDTFIEHINILTPHFSLKPKMAIFQPFLDKLEEIDITDYFSDVGDDSSHTKIPPSKVKANKRRKLKDAKKALNKGINMFKNLFGSEMITTFINGNSFMIEGQYYNYRFKKNSSLLYYTENINSHNIQYDLEIMDKKTDLIYGKLCTVFQDTPIIDQIISVILHIQSGAELKILENTNVYNKTEHFYGKTHYLRPPKGQRIQSANWGSPTEMMSEVIEDLDNRHSIFKEFKKRNSRQIYNDIQNRLKYNIEKNDVMKFLYSPPKSFDVIIDLASVLKDRKQLLIG